MALHTLDIKTITPRYDEIEDRIRLSLNHQNIQNPVDFMLTRRFILKLLPSYEEYIYKVYDKKIQTEDTHKTTKYNTLRITNHTELKPYQEDPELLQGIQFSFIQKSELTLLKLSTKHTEATATLNYESLTNIFALIKSAIPHFDWGISQNI